MRGIEWQLIDSIVVSPDSAWIDCRQHRLHVGKSITYKGLTSRSSEAEGLWESL